MIAIVLVLLMTAGVVLLTLYITLTQLLYVAPPDQALIFSGSTRVVAGRTLGYRFVRGGRRIRRPLIERVDAMDLGMFTVHVHVVGALSKGGIPLTIQAVANVKLPGDEPLLSNAVERFLGRSRQEILHIAKETLEGNLRGVLASLTPEQVNEDKLRFAQTLLDEAEHDMTRMGLVLDTLKIQNVTDDVNYLSSAGRIIAATQNQQQAIAEAEARAESAVQQASNLAAAEVAKLDADLQIAKMEIQKRIADARGKREVMIQEARGQVLAQVALARAEIERQKVRVVQERLRLEADVVQPALARQKAAEAAARGASAIIIERGRAEATALSRLVEVYRQGGAAARDALVLQNLLPLLGAISGANRPLVIDKLTVLPANNAPGSDLARTLIGASEQVRATTGVDLAAAAKKFSA